MRLEKVEIHNFKSIKRQEVLFKNNITCLIGKNESGKSSMLEAISFLDYYKLFGNNRGLKTKGAADTTINPYPAIQGTFALSSPKKFHNTIKEFKTFYDNFNLLENLFNTEGTVYYQVLRWGDGPENIEIVFTDGLGADFNLLTNAKDEKQINKIIELFFNLFYPSIQLFSEEQLTVKPATVEDLKGNKPEFETIRRLLIIGGCTDFEIFNSEDYNQISILLNRITKKANDLFNAYYIQDPSIKFKINYTKDKITVSVEDNTNEFYTLDERSPGFQYFFAFLINKRYLTFVNDKPNIFLLDEPGASLYPHGCRDLLKTFDFFSKSSQIIYTTHNVFLTLRNDLDSLIFTDRNPENGTVILHKTYKNKFQIFRKELGILLNDSFLIGDVNIVVEGDTELFVLRHLISEIVSEDENFNALEWLNIYNADGVTEIINSVRYLNSLGLSGIVLIDSDPEAEKESKKPQFKTLMSLPNWKQIQINELFENDNRTRTFEDLFKPETYLTAYNQHYNSSEYNFEHSFNPLAYTPDIQSPIIDIVKSHYSELFDEENKRKNKISKVNIARVLLENLKQVSVENRKNELENIFKLIKLINTKIQTLSHGNN